MVEYSLGKKIRYLPQVFFLILIILILFLSAHYTGFTRKYCGADTSCFEERVASCNPSEVYTSRDNNIYYYKMIPTLTGGCSVKIKFERAQEGTLQEHISLLEGKSMTCKVPRKHLGEINIIEMEQMMPYCTGPLKESLYELVIKRMYELVVSNLGEIAEQAEKAMKV
tara:strand:+ start:442 stop:945 length:504 start_codon:yes stop_codon:yes gene_type:complete